MTATRRGWRRLGGVALVIIGLALACVSGDRELIAAGGEESGGLATPEDWVAFRDDRYLLELRHPAGHETLTGEVTDDAPPPRPVARILVRDREQSASEVPALEVAIFDAEERQLADWLELQRATAPAAEETEYRLAGLDGVRRCRTTYLAPGCSIWVASGPWIYSFTPHGGTGDRILASASFSTAPSR